MVWVGPKKRQCVRCGDPFMATGNTQVRCIECQKVHRRERHRATEQRDCVCGRKKWRKSEKCMKCTTTERHVNRTPGLDATVEPTDLDIAWAAGFYEGEGSCVCAAGALRVSIPQQNLELLEKMQRLFGGRINPRNKSNCSVLVLYGPRAIRLVDAMYPYLSGRRKGQIDLAISRRWPDGRQVA